MEKAMVKINTYYNNNRSYNQRGRDNHRDTNVTLKAPYNFVPLSPYAPFFPDWGEAVSMDYPFKEGVSGKIQLGVTALSDIFVRDGSGDKSDLFNQIADKYFIPGTSIKGALRSVLEIVSFGKISRYNQKVSKRIKAKVEDAIPNRFKREGHDMADLIFGYTGEKDSLRGRVHVGHAFATKVAEPEEEELKYVLSTPHASYHLFYLKEGKGKWGDPYPEISGYKRYPTAYGKPGEKITEEQDRKAPDKMASLVKPLKAGSAFKCEITFYNLKPEELGALLYTLKGIKYHQLGGLKPYRYGKVKFDTRLVLKDHEEPVEEQTYIEAFKELMTQQVNPRWETGESIVELKAMAEGFELSQREEFKYMSLNDFGKGKSSGLHLKKFTEIRKK
jgi:CRISPR/Cas system CSM-associated protein Csm3 (group 7 of RAMP superfamily)